MQIFKLKNIEDKTDLFSQITERWVDGYMDRWIDRLMDRQIDGKTDRQIGE